MSVQVRRYRRTKMWEVDIVLRLPDGDIYRERRKAPLSSKDAAKRWGEQRAAHLFLHGSEGPKAENPVPTLAAFAPVFVEKYARGNQDKPSSIKAKESILAIHLLPAFGERRLDSLTQADVQRLKAGLKRRRPRKQTSRSGPSTDMLSKKTVNNILVTLSGLLKAAVTEGVLSEVPVTLELHRPERKEMVFYDQREFAALAREARYIGWRTEAMVLLGGNAGLRCGEMLGLRWSDIDFQRKTLTVRRSRWQGIETSPKSGHQRTIGLTRRLAELLQAQRGLGDREVLRRDDGEPATRSTLSSWMRVAQTAAGLERTGTLHILRHSFCSHLALAGVPAISIKELAGHSNLATTERYMHLRQVDKVDAVALLEQSNERADRNARAAEEAAGASLRGEILEKREPETGAQQKTEANSKT